MSLFFIGFSLISLTSCAHKNSSGPTIQSVSPPRIAELTDTTTVTQSPPVLAVLRHPDARISVLDDETHTSKGVIVQSEFGAWNDRTPIVHFSNDDSEAPACVVNPNETLALQGDITGASGALKHIAIQDSKDICKGRQTIVQSTEEWSPTGNLFTICSGGKLLSDPTNPDEYRRINHLSEADQSSG